MAKYELKPKSKIRTKYNKSKPSSGKFLKSKYKIHPALNQPKFTSQTLQISKFYSEKDDICLNYLAKDLK